MTRRKNTTSPAPTPLPPAPSQKEEDRQRVKKAAVAAERDYQARRKAMEKERLAEIKRLAREQEAEMKAQAKAKNLDSARYIVCSKCRQHTDGFWYGYDVGWRCAPCGEPVMAEHVKRGVAVLRGHDGKLWRELDKKIAAADPGHYEGKPLTFKRNIVVSSDGITHDDSVPGGEMATMKLLDTQTPWLHLAMKPDDRWYALLCVWVEQGGFYGRFALEARFQNGVRQKISNARLTKLFHAYALEALVNHAATTYMESIAPFLRQWSPTPGKA